MQLSDAFDMVFELVYALVFKAISSVRRGAHENGCPSVQPNLHYIRVPTLLQIPNKMQTSTSGRTLLRPQLLFGDQALHEFAPFLPTGLDARVQQHFANPRDIPPLVVR